MIELPGFASTSFAWQGVRKAVYRRGSGPGVVIMTEVPGITPQVADFAANVADCGFSVVLPDLLGRPGRPVSAPYVLSSLARACISREFAVLAGRRRSPITDWLRALARDVHRDVGGPGIGAIGMCLTGGFALALMLDEVLLAPVLSQPSLPLPVTRRQAHELHLAPEELAAVRARARGGVPVLGLRFTADPLCPKARFDRLRAELGSAFEAIEIDSSPGNPHGISRFAHSVLTTDLVDIEGHPTAVARDRVLEFLREQLS